MSDYGPAAEPGTPAPEVQPAHEQQAGPEARRVEVNSPVPRAAASADGDESGFGGTSTYGRPPEGVGQPGAASEQARSAPTVAPPTTGQVPASPPVRYDSPRRDYSAGSQSGWTAPGQPGQPLPQQLTPSPSGQPGYGPPTSAYPTQGYGQQPYAQPSASGGAAAGALWPSRRSPEQAPAYTPPAASPYPSQAQPGPRLPDQYGTTFSTPGYAQQPYAQQAYGQPGSSGTSGPDAYAPPPSAYPAQSYGQQPYAQPYGPAGQAFGPPTPAKKRSTAALIAIAAVVVVAALAAALLMARFVFASKYLSHTAVEKYIDKTYSVSGASCNNGANIKLKKGTSFTCTAGSRSFQVEITSGSGNYTTRLQS